MQIKKIFFLFFLIIPTVIFAFDQQSSSETKIQNLENNIPWLMYGSDTKHTFKIKAQISPPLTKLWGKERTNINPPVIYVGILYSPWADSTLCAFDVNDGKKLSEYSIKSKITTSPLILENFLFFGDERGTLFCLNTQKNKVAWEKNTQKGFYNSSPIPDNFSIYTNTLSGWIYNIKVDSGAISWGVKIKSEIKTSICLTEDLLYVASYDSCLYAIDKNTKKIEWINALPGKLYISPAVDDNAIYVPVQNKSLCAINRFEGEILWEKEFKSEQISGPVALSENSIYISTDKGVYLLEKNNGKERFKIDLNFPSPPIITDKILFIGDGEGNLYAFNKEKGKLYWKEHIMNDKILGLIIGEEKLVAWSAKELMVFTEKKQ